MASLWPQGMKELILSLSLSLVHNQPDVSLGWPGIFLLPMMLFPLTTIPKAVKTETE